MARYLAYTSPARGHLYPIVATLLELRERGHEVYVRTLASETQALRDLGLQTEPIDPRIENAPLDDWEASTPEEGLGRALATFARRASHEIPDLQEAIAQTDPEALLIDITTVGAAAVAEASGLPWARSIPLFQHFAFGPDTPETITCVPFTIAPEPGLEVLNGPRDEVGLPRLTDPDQAWRAGVHLYYTAEPFQPEGVVLPPSFRLVGPGNWEPPARVPPWLEHVERPLVLITTSSEKQADHTLIEAALEALGGEDVEVVVSTAAHDPARFPAPDNVHLERWLPHGPVIRKAECVLCHGGMGVTQKALAAGVPVCVVPFGRDQFEVAKRVAAADAGTMVPPDALTADTLRAALWRTVTMGSGAQRVAAGFARAGGAPAAAEELESLLEQSGVTSAAVGHASIR
jgi:MGT family glycosyltransferase